MKIIKQIFFFSFLLLLLIYCNDTSTEPLQQNYLDNFPVKLVPLINIQLLKKIQTATLFNPAQEIFSFPVQQFIME